MDARTKNLFCLIFLIIITALYDGGLILAKYFESQLAFNCICIPGMVIYPLAWGNTIHYMYNNDFTDEKDEKKYLSIMINILFSIMATIFFIYGLMFVFNIQNINHEIIIIAILGGIIYSMILYMCFCRHINIGLCLILWLTQKRKEKEKILNGIIYGG